MSKSPVKNEIKEESGFNYSDNVIFSDGATNISINAFVSKVSFSLNGKEDTKKVSTIVMPTNELLSLANQLIKIFGTPEVKEGIRQSSEEFVSLLEEIKVKVE